MGACCSSSYYARRERKRQMTEALVADAKANELLSRIPGRMCSNGASSTGCIFTQQGRKGTNQDAMVVWENYGCRQDTVFCGVFDGHGPYGHLVARRVRDSLPSKLLTEWSGMEKLCNNENGYAEQAATAEESAHKSEADTDVGERAYKIGADTDDAAGSREEPDLFRRWKDSMLKAFHSMDKDLRQHPTIDCFCSGSTAVTVLKQGDHLVVGNVGDSRAILAARRPDGDTLEAVQLTVDLKPSLPSEAERIRGCRGRVFALEDEPEVPRVWLPFDDAPGLAMARAFGDFCLKDFGLISVPEVTYRRLTPLDMFVVLATDGVWDVLSNSEVVDIVAWAPTRATAARAVVEAAVRAWRLKYPTSKVDDCAVVCLFLQPASSLMPRSASKTSTMPTQSSGEGNDAVRANSYSEEAKDEENAAEPGQEELHEADNDTEGIQFDRSNTVREVECTQTKEVKSTEIMQVRMPARETVKKLSQIQVRGKGGLERSQSVRSLADCLSTDVDDEDWSALEGVVRVNSLLNLPRVLGDQKAGKTGANS